MTQCLISLGIVLSQSCKLPDSLVPQLVKNLPAMEETQIPFLGRDDPLEKEMASHFSILAWRAPWTEEPGRLQFMGLKRVRHDWTLSNNNIVQVNTKPVTFSLVFTLLYLFPSLVSEIRQFEK